MDKANENAVNISATREAATICVRDIGLSLGHFDTPAEKLTFIQVIVEELMNMQESVIDHLPIDE